VLIATFLADRGCSTDNAGTASPERLFRLEAGGQRILPS
jgi:hypothetical protein